MLLTYSPRYFDYGPPCEQWQRPDHRLSPLQPQPAVKTQELHCGIRKQVFALRQHSSYLGQIALHLNSVDLLHLKGVVDMLTPWPHSVCFYVVVTCFDTELFPKLIERPRFQL